MQEVKRLFIAEFDNIKVWTEGKRNILSTITSDDYYLVYKRNSEMRQLPALNELLKEMSKNCLIQSTYNLNDSQYEEQILSDIKKYAGPETEIYFLYMDEQYKLLKSKIKNVKKVLSSRTYRVGRFYNSQKENSVSKIKNENGKKKTISPKKESPISTGISDITGAFANASKVENLKSESESEVKVNTQEENNETKGKIPFISGQGSAKGSVDKINVTKKKDDNSDTEISVNELEKMIFSNNVTSKDFQVEYTKIDDAKARLVALIYDRLIDNINRLSKNVRESNYSEHQYANLVTSLVKSNGYLDFKTSFKTVEPGDEEPMEAAVYEIIYEEATYYSKLCKLLYDDDLW